MTLCFLFLSLFSPFFFLFAFSPHIQCLLFSTTGLGQG